MKQIVLLSLFALTTTLHAQQPVVVCDSMATSAQKKSCRADVEAWYRITVENAKQRYAANLRACGMGDKHACYYNEKQLNEAALKEAADARRAALAKVK